MAHHHHPPNQPQVQGKEPGNFKVHTSSAATPATSHSSREVEKDKEAAPPHKTGKSIFDYQIAGFPWPFFLIMSLIAIAVLGLVLRVMGMF